MARTPPADNLDEAPQQHSLGCSCFEFLPLSAEISITHLPILYLISTQSFLEIKTCIALGTHHINIIQPKPDSAGSDAFVEDGSGEHTYFVEIHSLRIAKIIIILDCRLIASNERQRLEAGGLRFLCESR